MAAGQCFWHAASALGGPLAVSTARIDGSIGVFVWASALVPGIGPTTARLNTSGRVVQASSSPRAEPCGTPPALRRGIARWNRPRTLRGVLRPFIPAALAVLLVIPGCDAGRDDRATAPSTTSAETVPEAKPVWSSEAARAVRAQLRDDDRGPVQAIDCTQRDDLGRVLCNVEFRSTCDTYLAVRESSGGIAMRRPAGGTFCIFTTETVLD
jgi:hypothetical protein